MAKQQDLTEGMQVRVWGQFTDWEEFTVSTYQNGELGLKDGEEYIKDIREDAIEIIGDV